MNHLHQIIEQPDVLALRAFSPEEVEGCMRLFDLKCRSAICFDMGDLDDFSGMKRQKELLRLPYDICWFEGRVQAKGREVIVGFLVWNEEQTGGQCGAIFHKRTGEEWTLIGFWLRDGEALRVIPNEAKVATTVQHLKCWMDVFLTALHCCNVHKVETKPDAKLQKARSRKGKQPLFSYWTLHLGGDNNSTDEPHRGGSHASPRLHLRRGHPRQFKPGQWTWVQPHAVGNKKLGIVHKDYSLTPRNDE